MKTVHLLIWSEQGGGKNIIGAFSSKFNAVIYKDTFLNKYKYLYEDDYSIVEIDINPTAI